MSIPLYTRAIHTAATDRGCSEIRFITIADTDNYMSIINKSRCTGAGPIDLHNNMGDRFGTVNGRIFTVISREKPELGKDASHIFSGANTIEKIDLTGVGCSEIKTLNSAFITCFKLKELIFDKSITAAKIEDMSFAFKHTGLKDADLTQLDLSECNNFMQTFAHCCLLKSVKFNTDIRIQPTSMVEMFTMCLNLESVDLSMFNLSKTDMTKAFEYCNAVSDLDLSTINSEMLKDKPYISYIFGDFANIRNRNIKLPEILEAIRRIQP